MVMKFIESILMNLSIFFYRCAGHFLTNNLLGIEI